VICIHLLELDKYLQIPYNKTITLRCIYYSTNWAGDEPGTVHGAGPETAADWKAKSVGQ